MALPTVHFHQIDAGTGSSTLDAWMTKLHELLLAAGWTLEYADSDAIGSSEDPSEPAWDKTPATNTDAGVAVYRMPANDHDTRWYVRLRPGWAGSTARPYMRGITLGDTHDGSGTVTGGGNEVTANISSSGTSNSAQVLFAVSEDGFFLTVALTVAGTNVVALVERARRSDTGAVTDDLLAHVSYGAGGAALVRAGVGVVHNFNPIAFGSFTGLGLSSAGFSGVSFQNHDASSIPILGPYWLGGWPFFHGRLAFLVNLADHSPGGDRDLTIDGTQRTYRVAGNTAVSSDYGYWAVATE